MSERDRIDAPGLERLRIREEERRPARTRRRWPLILLGVVLVIVAASILLRPPAVRTVTVKAAGGGPSEAGGAVLTANGYVEARHQTSVAARTTGRLAELLVEEGDTVRAGQVVARLIDEDERAGVQQAEANLAVARARLEQARANEADAQRRARRRAAMLGEKQISEEEGQGAATTAEMARADRTAAEAGVKLAEADLETARLALEKTRVTAPFDGVVLRKDAEVGEIVGPIMVSNTTRAGAVVTIADMRTLEVGVDVNENYIARLSIGMPADVVLDAHPGVHFPGEIRTIYPSADRDRATVPVRVRFLAQDASVRPDLGAKVTFLSQRPTSEIVTIRPALIVPATAVQAKGTERFAWVVREGKVDPAPVTVGERSGDAIEILSGLTEGDQVVVGPSGRLRQGMRVRVTGS